MTMQIPDSCELDGQSWAIVADFGSGLYRPRDGGPRLEPLSTACWRGYIARYAVIDQQLWLRNVEMSPPANTGGGSGSQPGQGRDPSTGPRPIAYSGFLRLGYGRPDAVHRSQFEMRFLKVVDLRFEAGRLVDTYARDPGDRELRWTSRCVCAACRTEQRQPLTSERGAFMHVAALAERFGGEWRRTQNWRLEDLPVSVTTDLQMSASLRSDLPIQRCSHCGFVAHDLGAGTAPLARSAMTTARAQLAELGFAGDALDLMQAASHALSNGDRRAAIGIAMQAAWICDAPQPLRAALARQFALSAWPDDLPESQQPFRGGDPLARLYLRTETLRRVGRFAEAGAQAQRALASHPHRDATALFRFQRWLADAADDREHPLSDMPTVIFEEIAPWNREEHERQLAYRRERQRSLELKRLASQARDVALVERLARNEATPQERDQSARSPAAVILRCVRADDEGRLPTVEDLALAPSVAGALDSYRRNRNWPADKCPVLLALAIIDAEPSLSSYATRAVARWHAAVRDEQDLLDYLCQAIRGTTAMTWHWHDPIVDWHKRPGRSAPPPR